MKISNEARAIHNSAVIVDTHADTTQRFLDEKFDLATVTPASDGHMDFEKIRDGNLAAEFFSIWVDPQKTPREQYAHRTLQLIDSVYGQAEKHPDRMMMAFSVDDITKARRAGKFAALMGIEGGHSIENDLGLLRDFYRLGVRYMTLAWSNTNEWADSSGDIEKKDVKHHNGLTDFGKQVVLEMNHLGMMVDISHVSDKTFWDTIATTKAPVIASHSSARALNKHARNMTDDMLKAVSKNGGVVMVNYFSAFIDENFRQAYAAQKDERDAAIKALSEKYKNADAATRYRVLDRADKEWANKIPRPPFRSLIDHIDHIAKVAGIDHVGLGSDFDGVSSLPAEIDSTADLPKITQALVERGYNREQIHKILGRNILRVLRDVERVSRELKR
ncbi:MAG: dipeptidase [Acidobacteriales bacterium]|nr:dipeptidase [Terriglobales bacterium]